MGGTSRQAITGHRCLASIVLKHDGILTPQAYVHLAPQSLPSHLLSPCPCAIFSTWAAVPFAHAAPPPQSDLSSSCVSLPLAPHAPNSSLQLSWRAAPMPTAPPRPDAGLRTGVSPKLSVPGAPCLAPASRLTPNTLFPSLGLRTLSHSLLSAPTASGICPFSDDPLCQYCLSAKRAGR